MQIDAEQPAVKRLVTYGVAYLNFSFRVRPTFSPSTRRLALRGRLLFFFFAVKKLLSDTKIRLATCKVFMLSGIVVSLTVLESPMVPELVALYRSKTAV